METSAGQSKTKIIASTNVFQIEKIEKIGKADKVSRSIERNIIKELDMTALATNPEECLACEG